MSFDNHFPTSVKRVAWKELNLKIYIYHSRFIPKGIAEAFRIFLRNAHVLPKQLIYV
jgi:hypothetical protein